MEKYCPNCNLVFVCKADDINSCPCNTVKIDSKTSQIISRTYSDCLCIDCLLEITKKQRPNTGILENGL